MPDVFTVFLNKEDDDDDVPSDYNRVRTPPPYPSFHQQPGTKTFKQII